LNKNELIGAVAVSSGLTRSDATEAVEAVLRCISTALSRDEEVKVAGFGTFSVADRAASTGRNPRTGETIEIEASRKVKFRAGKTLKDEVS
jgi:DNA-binding protein HU-beta